VWSLVNKSLLKQSAAPNGTFRFGMLETLREFALEKLSESGEANEVCRRHAGYYVALRDSDPAQVAASVERIWHRRVAWEMANIQAALQWTGQVGMPELALQLASHLMMNAEIPEEGLRWVRQRLLWEGVNPVAQRLWAQFTEGVLARLRGDHQAERGAFETSLSLCHQLGSPLHVQSFLLWWLGWTDIAQGVFHQAVRRFEEAAGIAGADTPWERAWHCFGLAAAYYLVGAYSRAQILLDEAENVFQCMAPLAIHNVRAKRGYVAREASQLNAARAYFKRAIAEAACDGYHWRIASALAGLAGVFFLEGDAHRAARLFGMAEAIRESTATPLEPDEQYVNSRLMTQVKEVLSEEEWVQAWMEGHTLSMESALQEVTLL
jgi:tetratricopeptide (TPR) repeat protein